MTRDETDEPAGRPEARAARAPNWISRFFVGRDVFISYSRQEAATYAPALRSALGERGVSAYLDQHLAPPDRQRPASLDRHLRASRVLAVVMTASAATSEDVRAEVRIARERKQRVVVPIVIGDALPHFDFGSEPWSDIAGAAREHEPESNRTTGSVSPHVVNRLAAVAGAWRQERRLRLSIAVALVLIAAATVVAWFASRRAAEAQRAEIAATGRANAEAARAVQAATLADANVLAAQALSPAVAHSHALTLAAQSYDRMPANPALATKVALLTLLTRNRGLARVMRGQPVTIAPLSPVNDISAIAPLPDGVQVLWGDAGGTLYFGNTRSGRVVGRREHDRRIYAIDVSPDGALAATAGEAGEVILWDVAAARLLKTLRPRDDMRAVLAVAFAAPRVVTWIEDDRVLVADDVSDPASPRRLPPLPLLHDSISFAFTPDRLRVAVGGAAGEVDVYDWTARKPLPLRVPKRPAPVWRVTFGSPDVLATMHFGSDGTAGVVVSRLSDGKALYDEKTGTDVTPPVLDRSGRLVIGEKKTIRILSGDRTVASIANAAEPIVLAVANDGSVISGNRDGSVTWWAVPDARGGTVTPFIVSVPIAVRTENGVRRPTLFGFVPDGSRLAWIDRRDVSQRGALAVPRRQGHAGVAPVVTHSRNVVTIVDAGSGRAMDTINAPPESLVVDAAVTPDARFVALLITSRDGTTERLVVRDRTLGRDVLQVGVAEQASRVAISADGRTVAVGGMNERVEVWDVPRARREEPLAMAGAVSALAVSPNGSLIAACDMTSIAVFDRSSHLPLATFERHAERLLFTRDGSILAASGFNDVWFVPMTPRSWRDAAVAISGKG